MIIRFPPWNRTRQAHAGTLILTAVSWARKKGFIENAPRAGRVELPQPTLRGREARMSDERMDLRRTPVQDSERFSPIKTVSATSDHSADWPTPVLQFHIWPHTSFGKQGSTMSWSGRKSMPVGMLVLLDRKS